MRHISLFAGIGGFEYAAQTVWGDEWEPILFCEIDEFCQKVLKKHWSDVSIHPDIKDLNCEEYQGTIDLLTAGVPCQPASVAGKRKGITDDRWLWPQTIEIIRQSLPRWCIFENPRGILSLESGVVFENLLLEMESYGYEVQSLIIPACAVGACHRRDRVWIIAHSKQARTRDQKRKTSNQNGRTSKNWGEGLRQGNGTISTSGITPTNSNVANSKQSRDRSKIVSEEIIEEETDRSSSGIGRPDQSTNVKPYGLKFGDWSEHWYEAATRLCRMDVSPSRGLDRTARLKALGNTIQWEVAAEIMKAIKNDN